MSIEPKLAERLLTLRTERGLTQEEAAEKIGVSNKTYSKWETGSTSPDIETVVKLSQACLDALRKYWLLYKPDDYFFPGKKENRHIATATVNDWFNQYIKKFSFYNKSIHYHSLRHTFATNMLENGCDIFLLKKLLGHDSLQSTARYIHMQVSDIESAFSLSDVWGLQ